MTEQLTEVTATQEESSQQKAHHVLEKLAALELQRNIDREQRRAEAKAHQDPRENVEAFLAAFQQQQFQANTRIQECSQQSQQQGNDVDQAAVQGQLDGVALELAQMEKAVAEASYFLPSYDQKQCSLHIAELQTKLEAVRAQLLPVKKFSFGKRVARVKAATPAAGGTDAPSSAASAQSAAGSVQQAGSSLSDEIQGPSIPAPVQPSERDLSLVESGRGLKGLQGQEIVVRPEQLAGQEYVLIDLQGCTIFLLGHLTSLRILGMSGCKLFTGPITGSTFVHNVTGSDLVLASYQVRIHHTTDTQFYLRIKSRPIIEHSTGLQFAPYAFTGPKLQALLQEHKLDQETELYKAVDDFGWIKAVQSPNWSVLPEEQRMRAIDEPQQPEQP